MNRDIELEAAEALLDAGISLPLFRIKLPGAAPWMIRVTMKRPYWGTCMRIARIFLKQGIDVGKLASMSEEEELRFFDKHLIELSKMIALTICRGYLSGMLLAPLVAWLIRWRVPHAYLIEAQRRFRKLKASRDFTRIIAWAEVTNPFRAEASHNRIGS